MSIASEVIKETTSVVSATSMFYFLLLPAVALWFVYWRLSRRHLYKMAEKLPGIEGYPLVGNLFDVLGSSHCKSY